MVELTPQKRFLSERDVARMLNRPVSGLQQDRHYTRGLPYHKLGKLIRYDYDEVIAFMQNCRVDPDREA